MAFSTATALPGDAPTYERHRPEQTSLYALIDEHFPRFLERLEADGVSLPHFVKEEFEAYLKCGRLEYGFLRVKCDACRHEKLVAFKGLLLRDDDTPSLDLEPADGFEQLLGAAVHYRIATGPHTGRKALTRGSEIPSASSRWRSRGKCSSMRA